MGTGKQYDEEFKKQAIKLAKEIGIKAADELRSLKGRWGRVCKRRGSEKYTQVRAHVHRESHLLSHSSFRQQTSGSKSLLENRMIFSDVIFTQTGL